MKICKDHIRPSMWSVLTFNAIRKIAESKTVNIGQKVATDQKELLSAAKPASVYHIFNLP